MAMTAVDPTLSAYCLATSSPSADHPVAFGKTVARENSADVSTSGSSLMMSSGSTGDEHSINNSIANNGSIIYIAAQSVILVPNELIRNARL